MGSKLAWVMLTQRDRLRVRVLGGKYLRGKSSWEAKAATIDSWLWKSIVHHREALLGGLCYIVGNGRDILALRDPWLSAIAGFKPTLREGAAAIMDLKVSDFLVVNERCWDEAKLQSVFTPDSVAAILQIKLSPDDQPDKKFWPLEPSGEFLVKSVYRNLVATRGSVMSPLRQEDWKDLWSLKMHDRLKLLLMWKVGWDTIPIKCKVAERIGRQDSDLLCSLWGEGMETLHHLLLVCPFSRAIWCESHWQINIVAFSNGSVVDWIKIIIHPCESK
ncbi:hypothetical protein CJ030_MR0G005448 [Morella rubra]|uniref:Reverse transcriptase zinc-binding domain-containing protein n=1 Tax=Morella rubra TaxID=262757 RepID=A0A6A1UL99_9ROSI|nr:hypothetical protein CJ030_MR0G005448 [Morella rubra]